MLLLVLVDAVVLSILLRRLMKREFPESVRRASHIGYGVTRALTMRWMRLPRPQDVSILLLLLSPKTLAADLTKSLKAFAVRSAMMLGIAFKNS